ncbi:hypothetical protein A2160_05070 [Candidatus Beckwithbacteria bacterium RBG_13_42_9]|uniref:Fibronectin type-III domain-containing protein n=1 Tax=Candidatus Beckwithbacteria bacterium RBG_13_42_9 TaxID=1797457 RepID=A0A1F5E6G2_9BACT|nr:MAG: hypothetical protein A2160_05070 [Candidatus Beckwithbacteria bacterium RBG_13_42_9]
MRYFNSAPDEDASLTAYAQAVIKILKKLAVMTVLLAVPTTAILVTQQDLQLAQIYVADSERTATLTVDPQRSTVLKGELFTVKVYMDPGGAQISEAKAVLHYDHDLIQIDNVNFPTYAKNNTVSIDNANGQATIRSFFDAGLTSKVIWFETVISTHGTGTANFWFDCRRGATDETNVIRLGGDDIVNCNNIGQGWFTVNLVNASPTTTSTTGCGGTSPAAPTNLTATPGPGWGELTLRWNKISGAGYYTVTYGKNSASYQFGSPNIGDTDHLVIRGLIPGQRYYVVMTAVNGCASSGYSSEVSATAGYGAITKTTYDFTKEKGFQPPIPPEFIPEKSATPSASAEATPSASVSPGPLASPAATGGGGVTKPWQRLDFWLLAGGIALGGLVLVLLGSLLGRGGPKNNEPPFAPPPPPPQTPAEPFPQAPTTNGPQISSLPPSPWDENPAPTTPVATDQTGWPAPPSENKQTFS